MFCNDLVGTHNTDTPVIIRNGKVVVHSLQMTSTEDCPRIIGVDTYFPLVLRVVVCCHWMWSSDV